MVANGLHTYGFGRAQLELTFGSQAGFVRAGDLLMRPGFGHPGIKDCGQGVVSGPPAV